MTFAFYTFDSPKRGYNVRAKIFRIKKNRPILLGTCDWNTASCKGDESEVATFLVNEKHIPKTYVMDGVYTHWSDREDKGWKLVQM